MIFNVQKGKVVNINSNTTFPDRFYFSKSILVLLSFFMLMVLSTLSLRAHSSIVTSECIIWESSIFGGDSCDGYKWAEYTYTNEAVIDYFNDNYSVEPSSIASALYQGSSGREDIEVFDGMGYFLSKMKAENIKAFPNFTWVPIAGEVILIIPTTGPLPKNVGTPYVEKLLIKEQIDSLIDRSWILGYSSATAQTKALYDNGVKFAKELSLEVGSDFSLESIPYDLIWPEIRVINGEEVYVPIVYLTPTTIAANNIEGNTLSFGTANLNYDTILVDGATINARRSALINAQSNFFNSEGEVIGGEIAITAGQNIENLSGLISGTQVTLIAEQIKNETLVIRYDYGHGYTDYAQDLATISSVGDITLTTSGDVISSGAIFNAQGDLKIDAGGSVTLVTQPVESYRYEEGSYWSDSEQALESIQSQLSGENISILAGTTILIEGAILESPGSIKLLAGMGIYVTNGTNQYASSNTFEAGSGGVFGNSVSIEEQSQQTEIVRTLIKAGKNLTLNSFMGNITLKAVDFRSEGFVAVEAEGGFIEFKLAKELDSYSYSYDEENALTFKTKGMGHQIETGIYNDINANGEIYLTADQGLKIEYAGEGSFEDTLDAFAQSPGLAWMKEVSERDDVQWTEMTLAMQSWDYEAQGLTEAGAVIVAIACAVATGGAGAAALGPITAASSAMTVAGAAAISAGAATLATQAVTFAVANDGDLGKTLKDMGREEQLVALAQSMVIAGVSAGINHKLMSSDIVPPDSATNSTVVPGISDQTYRGLVSATVSATVSGAVNSYVNGTGWSEFGTEFTQSLASHAIYTLGEKAANQIGAAADLPLDNPDRINIATQYIAHAALGCTIGIASNMNSSGSSGGNEEGCWSGAGGAVIGEFVGQIQRENAEREIEEFLKLNGEELLENGTIHQVVAEKWDALKKNGVDMAKLSAALGAYALGGDISIAAETGANAAENNAWEAKEGDPAMILIMKFIAYGMATPNPLDRLAHFGAGTDPLSIAIQNAGDDFFSTVGLAVPDSVKESYLEAMGLIGGVVSDGVMIIVNNCGDIPGCKLGEQSWNSLTDRQKNMFMGAVNLIELIIPGPSLVKVNSTLSIQANNPNVEVLNIINDPNHPDAQNLSTQDRANLNPQSVTLDELISNGPYKTEYTIGGHLPGENASGNLTYKNDGVLGEEMTNQIVKDVTGHDFRSLQNNSNQGLDHGFIDITNETIEIMDTKSTVNGISVAPNPEASAETRLNDWVDLALQGDASRWKNLPPENIAFARELRKALEAGFEVKSYVVKVEVPRVRPANADPSTVTSYTLQVEISDKWD